MSASAGDDTVIGPGASLISGDLDEASSSAGAVEAVPFSSGNPRIEETRGVMHLHPDSASSSSSSIFPDGRKPLVCVMAVPNHMTYADFCKFCGSFIHHMLEMRIVRIDGVDDQYSVIIKFDEQSSTDGFYKHFNQKCFSSLEGDICHVRYTINVEEKESIEHAQSSVSSLAEQPSCPVCLERLDQDSGGILTTICNHSFHCSCISKWSDSSCPVCRYCQQQAERSTCFICCTNENLWMCVICGFVGCGRYKERHAILHWKETQHCYSLELETQRVWDYVGDNYVHRLIQSKTDNKLVELSANSHEIYDYVGESGFSEALLNSKFEAIVEEYNNLLTSQLENQRKHYESLLLEIKEENDKEISEAVEKALSAKQPKLQAKINKALDERKFLEEMNKSLLENRQMWEEKIQKAEKREQIVTRVKDAKINQLEEQLSALIAQIESPNTNNGSASSESEIQDGIVLPLGSSVPSNSNNGTTQKSNKGRKNNKK